MINGEKDRAMKIAEEHHSYVCAWDLPTRMVHWIIAVAVPILWWTGSHGKWQIHIAMGEVLFGSLVFRITWGFIGASTARFANLLKGPRQVLRYSQTLFSGRETWTKVGHNPLGSWSAAALLAALAISVTSGLFSETLDGLAEGPLSEILTEYHAQTATVVHQAVYELLLTLLVLHLSAVAFYKIIKRQNLLSAMVHGQRLLPRGSIAMQPAKLRARVFALLVATGSVVAVVYMSTRDHHAVSATDPRVFCVNRLVITEMPELEPRGRRASWDACPTERMI